MKIMCDTNVILDVLLERESFVEDSYKILKLCEEHKIEGFVSASSVTDIFYLVLMSNISSFGRSSPRSRSIFVSVARITKKEPFSMACAKTL